MGETSSFFTMISFSDSFDLFSKVLGLVYFSFFNSYYYYYYYY